MMKMRNIVAAGATIAIVSVGANAVAEESVSLLADVPVAAAEEQPAAAAVEPAPAATEEATEETAEPAAAVTEEKAEPAPAVAEEKAEPVSPDAELLENIRTTEQLRRESLDAQAKREIEAARECMSDDEYEEAVQHYGLASKLLNDRPASKKLKKECEQGMAEGLYRAALQEDDLGRREAAKEKMQKALEMRHPKARKMLAKWDDEATSMLVKPDFSDIKDRINDDDFKQQREKIRKHLKRSRQFLAVREMSKALDEVEIVLVYDPYNQEALRLRDSIQKKRQTILEQERATTRDGMIADVNEAWRPVYAVNAAQLGEASAETVKAQLGDDPERTQEQNIERRMREMRLPQISFRPPATIMDAIEFFRQASKDYDRPDIPAEKRGFNFVLKTPQPIRAAATDDEGDDFAEGAGAGNGLAQISPITASDITFYEALQLVCDSVDYKFIVRGPVVMVMHKDASTAELLARKYNVPEAFVERVNTASEEMKSSGGFGSSKGKAKQAAAEDEGEDQDWKGFFREMGVQWPEGSSIKHIKALGKLYVRNTRENLAEFEKVLDEMGGQTQLVEIETRFVEVSQEDLNSLGFEWILNSDYTLNAGHNLGKALGLNHGAWNNGKWTSSRDLAVAQQQGGGVATGSDATGATGGATSSGYGGFADNTATTADTTTGNAYSSNVTAPAPTPVRGAGVNAFGGTTDYSNGNRYLSTSGNHISGESKSTNDQFMRVNAFLGSADLSMILHMLSQRSDTDLLSAPKIVTKSGEHAVIKVVTEYIYPTDYDVQLQSSSSSSSSSGGSSSAILAVVEPQNFNTREVGVILDVTPTYSEANGGTIELELNPEVVDEPTWHNYGMKIPFTGNASNSGTSLLGLDALFGSAAGTVSSAISSLVEANSESIAQQYVDSAIASMNPSTITYYDAPMEQPFFHTRKIETKVSIAPGATVVMGGLITESRKAMDDKIPFLGDLPFVGRLFRSHAESTTKRNLLIFVTGRLITPAGRELKMGSEADDSAEVKAAPAAE